MNKLEELLNKFIGLWRKPRNENQRIKCIDEYTLRGDHDIYSINDLCSNDSWLWQVVVENKVYKDVENHYIEAWIKHEDDTINNITDDKYRLMMSSIAEDKVQFILDNIKEIVLDTE